MAKRDEITSLIAEEVTKHPYWPILPSFPRFGATAAATIIGVVKHIDMWQTRGN